jgi:primosomal protein N' (replication factor Y)
MIQTHHPDHPLFSCLIQQGYTAFAHTALLERQQVAFPPFTRLALLRAESKEKEEAHTFLQTAKQLAQVLQFSEVTLWGPVPAPIERQGNWYRSQLLLQANVREPLHELLDQWLPCLPSPKKTLRWSLDVDPQDLM